MITESLFKIYDLAIVLLKVVELAIALQYPRLGNRTFLSLMGQSLFYVFDKAIVLRYP